MKYEETCTCGAKMQLETNDRIDIVRAKAQWKIDHGDHGDNTITIERKRALLEYNDLRARVKMAEDKAYPAMVQAYEMIVADKKKGKVLYQVMIHPGNGFHWEDPKSPITVNLRPTTMKLPDLEEKELAEAEAKDSFVTAQVQSQLQMTVPAGDKAPPVGSVLDNLKEVKDYGVEMTVTNKPWVQPIAKQIRETIVGKTEVSDEQGKQAQGKRDDGAAKTKRITTRSRIRSDDVGRRRNPRQG